MIKRFDCRNLMESTVTVYCRLMQMRNNTVLKGKPDYSSKDTLI